MSVEIGSNWWNDFLAPSIVVVIIIAVAGWLKSYLAGKRSNIKEARVLEENRIDRADKKGVKERLDAKVLETEKISAANIVEEKRKSDAIDVKKETNERMDNKFRFSDQEHFHQHSQLKNELKELKTMIEQVNKDLKDHINDSQDEDR